jgi:hypothetical protein
MRREMGRCENEADYDEICSGDESESMKVVLKVDGRCPTCLWSDGDIPDGARDLYLFGRTYPGGEARFAMDILQIRQESYAIKVQCSDKRLSRRRKVIRILETQLARLHAANLESGQSQRRIRTLVCLIENEKSYLDDEENENAYFEKELR